MLELHCSKIQAAIFRNFHGNLGIETDFEHCVDSINKIALYIETKIAQAPQRLRHS